MDVMSYIICILLLTLFSHSELVFVQILIVIIIIGDDLSNIYTVEEAVHEIGFGVFQILLSLFCGAIWVIAFTYYL